MAGPFTLCFKSNAAQYQHQIRISGLLRRLFLASLIDMEIRGMQLPGRDAREIKEVAFSER
jgi:hypothetical protein